MINILEKEKWRTYFRYEVAALLKSKLYLVDKLRYNTEIKIDTACKTEKKIKLKINMAGKENWRTLVIDYLRFCQVYCIL